MSKELEFFRKIKASILKQFTLGGIYKFDELNKIEKALTPPTSDEVCEALSEYYGVEVLHNTYEHDDINETFMRDAFYRVKIKFDMDGKPYKVKHDIVAGGVDGITLNAWLPPYLITMIGRFYEGLEKLK